MMRTGTPAILSSTSWLGQSLLQASGGRYRPGIGPGAALGQRLRRALIRLGAAQQMLRRVAEAGRDGNNPRNVRRSLGVDVAGVAGGRIRRGGGFQSRRLGGQRGGGQKNQESG
jgi:hypothetical protein